MKALNKNLFLAFAIAFTTLFVVAFVAYVVELLNNPSITNQLN